MFWCDIENETSHLERRRFWEDKSKMNLGEMERACYGLDAFGSFEYCNGTSVSITFWEIFEFLPNSWLLMKQSASWISVNLTTAGDQN
jgi:hypothetical protein